VQEQLSSRTLKRTGNADAHSRPVAGKVFDEHAEPLYVQGAANGQRRYRYYVSRKLVQGPMRNGPGGALANQDKASGCKLRGPALGSSRIPYGPRL
jgi:hypothetical protein